MVGGLGEDWTVASGSDVIFDDSRPYEEGRHLSGWPGRHPSERRWRSDVGHAEHGSCDTEYPIACTESNRSGRVLRRYKLEWLVSKSQSGREVGIGTDCVVKPVKEIIDAGRCCVLEWLNRRKMIRTKSQHLTLRGLSPRSSRQNLSPLSNRTG